MHQFFDSNFDQISTFQGPIQLKFKFDDTGNVYFGSILPVRTVYLNKAKKKKNEISEIV